MKINTWIICGIALLASACGNTGGITGVGSLNNHQDSPFLCLGDEYWHIFKDGIIG